MKDMAQIITDKVIEELQGGTIPWRKPWSINGLVPTSLQTGKAYKGTNAFWLTLWASALGYESNLWITYKQAQAMGGNVRKGEKATDVIFWKKVTGKEDAEGQKIGRDFMIMKSFAVFNVAQCEGLVIPEKYQAKPREWSDSEALDRLLDNYLSVSGPDLQHRAQEKAFYSPSVDVITLPPKDSFDSLKGYAETLLHEVTHSTGHKDRLDRFTDTEQPARFGNETYAREELVAEFGAMMLMTAAGIEPDMAQGAAYIQNWLTALQNDKGLLIQAAQRAAKAVDWVTVWGNDDDEEGEA